MRKTAARLIAALLIVGPLAACHSIERGVYAQAPVPLSVLPLREPVTYTVGPNAGRVVPTQHGLLASYFNGADYAQPAYNEYLDHQQIDPNVDFSWDGSDTNPVIPAGHGGIDVSEGDPFLPDHWPIWSAVWEGYLDVPATGSYGLNLHVNNGGWLEMKDATGSLTTVISCPGGSGFEGDCPATKTLSTGRQYIRISYYNNAPSSANAIFSWQKPGDTALSVVPTETLWTQLAPASVNAAPSVTLLCPARVYVHDGMSVTGSFIDPDAGQTWTATYDGLNQAGPAPLPLNADHSFALSVDRSRLTPGTFNVVVAVADSAGSVGTATCTVIAVPKRVMFYLHGTTGSFDQNARTKQNDFPSLLNRLADSYEVRFFEYYEDAGNKLQDSPTFACQDGKRRVELPIDPASGMPLDLPPLPDPYPGICDSNDDVEINAALLDGDIQRLGLEFDNVTLLSNSGGGRMVRAYLAYASSIHSPSLGLVDLVASLEGVQAGTWVAAAYDGMDVSVSTDPEKATIRDRLFDFVKPLLKHDPRRPLKQDVTPRSPNITYTNATVAVPNGTRYLNVDGDIRVNIIDSIFLIPVNTSTFEVGDTVMLPGDDDPRAMPDTGGGRFLPSVAGRGLSSDEWELTRFYDVNIDRTLVFGSVTVAQIVSLATAPESHLFLGAKFDQMCVRYSGVRRLDAVVFDQIRALDSGLPPAAGKLGLGRQSEVACP